MIRWTSHNPNFERNSVMDAFIGSLSLVAFNFAPPGWMFCQGQMLSISQNQPLFALIGTTYGGDGQTNFKLPNLTGPTDASGATLNWMIALVGIFPSRG
jgi:microcystin-dependent protein